MVPRPPRPSTPAGAAMPPGWTRGEFVRGALGAGVGLALAGGGYGAYRLLDSRGASAATATEPGKAGVRRFVSRPDLTPPALTVRGTTGSLARGLLFLAPFQGPAQAGALIVDNRGEPIWFRPSNVPGIAVMNLRAALYRGRPVLTWWEGAAVLGLGEGTHVIADDAYNVLARFPSGNGLASDLHEFILSPSGTALVTSYEKRQMDLRRVGGAKTGTVVGGVAQELDVATGRLLFEWRSLDHVPVTDAFKGSRTDPFDSFHINAIDVTPDGNFLISSRNTWAVYKIDRGSGEIIWRLGGKRSDFRMGPGTLFAWQHDARYHATAAGALVSLFDDGAAPKVQPESRAVVIALDIKRMRATLHQAHTHRPATLAEALGSNQILANGNWLVGWGTAPYLTEFGPDGRVLFDVQLPAGTWNYRALRFPWTATPAARPTLVSHRSTGSPRLYVSWNGATRVASWQLRAGRTEAALAVASTTPRSGFETPLEVPANAHFAAAVAIDATGSPLGASPTVRI